MDPVRKERRDGSSAPSRRARAVDAPQLQEILGRDLRHRAAFDLVLLQVRREACGTQRTDEPFEGLAIGYFLSFTARQRRSCDSTPRS